MMLAIGTQMLQNEPNDHNDFNIVQTSGGRRSVYALRAMPRQAASTRIYQERNWLFVEWLNG